MQVVKIDLASQTDLVSYQEKKLAENADVQKFCTELQKEVQEKSAACEEQQQQVETLRKECDEKLKQQEERLKQQEEALCQQHEEQLRASESELSKVKEELSACKSELERHQSESAGGDLVSPSKMNEPPLEELKELVDLLRKDMAGLQSQLDEKSMEIIEKDSASDLAAEKHKQTITELEKKLEEQKTLISKLKKKRGSVLKKVAINSDPEFADDNDPVVPTRTAAEEESDSDPILEPIQLDKPEEKVSIVVSQATPPAGDPGNNSEDDYEEDVAAYERFMARQKRKMKERPAMTNRERKRLERQQQREAEEREQKKRDQEEKKGEAERKREEAKG
eukprot:TRINITY_DN158_c0_g1_i1.p1 TRINITY_DN158_c0_g1~~TRINITY_DN158_c0_g1_i1.p1  ORF type:complete len:337 (-),score=115.95 TRINITY_DN158_c0_g1_i1:47-1057(-)